MKGGISSLLALATVAAVLPRCAGTCFDTDDGATDRRGQGCSFYDLPGESHQMSESGQLGNCNYYGDWDFSANSMCCACGGGVIGKVPRPWTCAAAVSMAVVPSSARRSTPVSVLMLIPLLSLSSHCFHSNFHIDSDGSDAVWCGCTRRRCFRYDFNWPGLRNVHFCERK